MYDRATIYAETLLSSLTFGSSHPITANVNGNIALTPQNIAVNIAVNPTAVTIARTTSGNIPFISVRKDLASGSRTVGFNGYLGTISPAKDTNGVIIHNYAVLIYNSVYWCMGFV